MIGLLATDNTQNQLWKVFERERFVTKDQFKEALKQARREERHLNEVLLDTEAIPQEKVLTTLSAFYDVPVILLREVTISPYVLNLIPKEVAEEHSVIVFKKLRDVIHVATTKPDNHQTIAFIRKKTGCEPKVFLTTPEDIQHALKKYQGELTEEFAKIIERSTRETLELHDTVEKMAQYVPIVTMVNTILERALLQNASDIHFEPKANIVAIRFRVDGLLHNIVELPKDLLPPLVTRIKLLANLKIDEHRLPQDGRFKFIFKGRDVAIRVSVMPTLHGAKVVLRLLDTRTRQFSLRSLGLNQRDLGMMRKEITKPHGMILVTGPTGSGKTTTLYTILRMLNRENVNICTIEDPIEYGVEGINQTQANPAAGLTFANGLRSLLRQDPNIMMVGEIRDVDTADIALNAAMTGHLVLTTLHTNSAFLTTQRLLEMGVQPFLAASVINVIIGQRLVRRVCRHCKTESRLTQKHIEDFKRFVDVEAGFRRLQQLGLLSPEAALGEQRLSYGRGCDKCQNTGYRGRVGIYETLIMNEDLRRAVLRDPAAASLESEARQGDALTMGEDGLLKIFQGLTTLEEIVRVTK